MASTERIRIEIGFDGGQVMGAHVLSSAADDLERALASTGDGAFAIDTDDGRTVLAIRRIVYVKRFAREARLGFGNL
jgi:hypothetical protein